MMSFRHSILKNALKSQTKSHDILKKINKVDQILYKSSYYLLENDIPELAY